VKTKLAGKQCTKDKKAKSTGVIMASKGSIARPGTSKGSLSHLLLQKLASNGSEQSLASRAQPRRRKAILEYALKHGSKREEAQLIKQYI
tara:strand:- start:832 stop:1101 length:270 start_codon:yes stop_codon:yes gene_type:complete